ncbi:MAG: ABC transporter permease [Planctomycetota bacterium]
MLLLVSAINAGLIFALLALGVYISFRVFNFPDITADGSFAFGGAATTALLIRGVDPVTATAAGFLAGMLAGALTGTLHTRFGIHGLLSGILVMTALYSVNLRVLGRSNVPLNDSSTLLKMWATQAERFFGNAERRNILGWEVGTQELATLAFLLILTAAAVIALLCFLETKIGAAMRGCGDNPQMIRAMGVSDKALLTAGVALANGFAGLSGSLLAQYQEFADIQMGIGMVIWGLASVIIGESLVGPCRFGPLIVGAVMGSLLFRILIAIALRCGLDPNDLKLITAFFVFIALVMPQWTRKRRPRSPGSAPEVADHA